MFKGLIRIRSWIRTYPLTEKFLHPDLHTSNADPTSLMTMLMHSYRYHQYYYSPFEGYVELTSVSIFGAFLRHEHTLGLNRN